MKTVKLVECPRDAMQGIVPFIPTDDKVEYLNKLLQCGFDTLDFGSFVSPKAIPQLKDTKDVLSRLDPSPTKLLAIVANSRGAEEAVNFDQISYIGFPFSVSETFQLRNTNTDLESALKVVHHLKTLCVTGNKKLVVYLSMGFGNPYGDEWSPEIVAKWCEVLINECGIEHLAPSDTIGCANKEIVSDLFSTLITAFPKVEFGSHLHARREHANDLIEAAFQAGCRRFDGAILGLGGCPMAKDDLTGNMPTDMLIDFMNHEKMDTGINLGAFHEAQLMAKLLFNKYH
jgi:hydroxymethylglutaryl-CoA lyase